MGAGGDGTKSKTQNQKTTKKTHAGSLIRKPLQIIMLSGDLPKLDI